MRPPQFGFNHNIRHGSALYHVQTEDSGPRHNHINTHLYADGGRIIASKKFNYAHLIAKDTDDDEALAIIKAKMQALHKLVCRALLQGLFDQGESEGAQRLAALDLPDSVAEKP